MAQSHGGEKLSAPLLGGMCLSVVLFPTLDCRVLMNTHMSMYTEQSSTLHPGHKATVWCHTSDGGGGHGSVIGKCIQTPHQLQNQLMTTPVLQTLNPNITHPNPASLAPMI